MRFPGNRIVKTAVAVLLTALICQALGWPPVFAVITAVVSLEPTVSDSIKKGLVRFPASAIGSFYAVLFIALFGGSPLTYTLAATLTIITCYRLKLHDGLLVATITAVAMIEVVYDDYFMSFFIRLGTTTIGITVSTLVNLLIFPPNFMKDIQKNLSAIYEQLGYTLYTLVEGKQKQNDLHRRKVNQLLVKTEQLVHYETSDVEYFRLEDEKQQKLIQVKEELEQLRIIRYHINNLDEIELANTAFTKDHKQTITETITHIAQYMTGDQEMITEENELTLREIMKTYWNERYLPDDTVITKLPTELVLLYELLSIIYLVNEFEQRKKREIYKEFHV